MKVNVSMEHSLGSKLGDVEISLTRGEAVGLSAALLNRQAGETSFAGQGFTVTFKVDRTEAAPGTATQAAQTPWNGCPPKIRWSDDPFATHPAEPWTGAKPTPSANSTAKAPTVPAILTALLVRLETLAATGDPTDVRDLAEAYEALFAAENDKVRAIGETFAGLTELLGSRGRRKADLGIFAGASS